MATLTGTTIQSTYDSLLKVTDNDSITGSLKRITDGLGNNTPLYLSSSAVEIVSALNVIGNITGTNLSGTNTGDETKASIESKLGAATSSNSGYLTSTDWSTFNNKIAGSGTLNKLAKFSSSSSIADSTITDTGSAVTIGVATTVSGNLTASALIKSGGTASQILAADGSVITAGTNITISGGTISSSGGISGSGTTNTIPKFTGSTAIGNSNITDTGSLITLGSNSYIGGQVGIGTSSLGVHSLTISLQLQNSATIYGVLNNGVAQSTATNAVNYFGTVSNTAAGSYTIPILRHYIANGGTFGAGSVVSTQVGYDVNSTLNGATTNYGFRGRLAAATGVWNLYMDGTANNYLAGSLGIGSTTLTEYSLRLSKTITGATVSYGVQSQGVIQSDVTSIGAYYSTLGGTQATTFTLDNLMHFRAAQGTFGAGSTVTNQYGVRIDSNLIGATNNFGLWSNIPSGTNRWNLYMNGTADNYLAGALGIGSTTLTGINLRVERNIAGATIGYGVLSAGEVQSGVTSSARYFQTISSASATVSTGGIFHYRSAQGTFASGASIGDQVGFQVDSSLTGATNNYGFRGQIPAGTNRWNLFMDGTADNHMAGSLGIGSTSLTVYNLRVVKNITGGTFAWGISQEGQVQSQVTDFALSFNSTLNTAAASFNTQNYAHYNANQGVIGAGSTIGTQFGFRANSSLTAATNNYGFFGDIPSGTGRWNLYMNGTADNYLAGALGIGSTTLTGYNINIARNLTGAVTSRGIQQAYTVQSDVTNAAIIYSSAVSTQATAFTLPQLTHYFAGQGTIGAGSTVTDQHGFRVESTLIGATNNYGFRGQIPSGTNRWNLYMDGTANNYLAGSLGIGSTSLTGYNLRVSKTITGGAVARGIVQEGVVQSDVTLGLGFANSLSTQAASFTLNDYYHFRIGQGTIGAGSTVTNQHGFFVENTLTGATNNFAFRSDLAAGTGRWNLYMAGTANNYMAGALGIGSTSLATTSLRISRNGTGGTQFLAIDNQTVFQSDVTVAGIGYNTFIGTQATAFTLAEISHFRATQGTIGAGSTVTTQVGFNVSSGLIGGTNNYGFRGSIPSGTGRFNLYMDGTASNYLAGNLGIGTTSPAFKLQVGDGTGTGSQYVRVFSAAADIYIGQSGGTLFGFTTGTAGVIANDKALPFAIGTTPTQPLVFGTSNAERMRIFSGGNIAIGSTTDNNTGAKLQVNGGMTYQNLFNRRTASYTLTINDQNYIVEMNVGTANNLTIPPNSSVAFPIGTEIAIIQYGAGQTTIVAGAGVTLRSKSNALKISGQYAGCTCVKVGTDEWYVIGDLTL